MSYKKITKDDAEKLKVGDKIFLYSDGRVVDSFDETDEENITLKVVESIVLNNVELSVAIFKDGIPFRFSAINKKLHELYEEGRYWIQAKDD